MTPNIFRRVGERGQAAEARNDPSAVSYLQPFAGYRPQTVTNPAADALRMSQPGGGLSLSMPIVGQIRLMRYQKPRTVRDSEFERVWLRVPGPPKGTRVFLTDAPVMGTDYNHGQWVDEPLDHMNPNHAVQPSDPAIEDNPPAHQSVRTHVQSRTEQSPSISTSGYMTPLGGSSGLQVQPPVAYTTGLPGGCPTPQYPPPTAQKMDPPRRLEVGHICYPPGKPRFRDRHRVHLSDHRPLKYLQAGGRTVRAAEEIAIPLRPVRGTPLPIVPECSMERSERMPVHECSDGVQHPPSAYCSNGLAGQVDGADGAHVWTDADTFMSSATAAHNDVQPPTLPSSELEGSMDGWNDDVLFENPPNPNDDRYKLRDFLFGKQEVRQSHTPPARPVQISPRRIIIPTRRHSHGPDSPLASEDTGLSRAVAISQMHEPLPGNHRPIERPGLTPVVTSETVIRRPEAAASMTSFIFHRHTSAASSSHAPDNGPTRPSSILQRHITGGDWGVYTVPGIGAMPLPDRVAALRTTKRRGSRSDPSHNRRPGTSILYDDGLVARPEAVGDLRPGLTQEHTGQSGSSTISRSEEAVPRHHVGPAGTISPLSSLLELPPPIQAGVWLQTSSPSGSLGSTSSFLSAQAPSSGGVQTGNTAPGTPFSVINQPYTGITALPAGSKVEAVNPIRVLLNKYDKIDLPAVRVVALPGNIRLPGERGHPANARLGTPGTANGPPLRVVELPYELDVEYYEQRMVRKLGKTRICGG